MNTQIFPTSLFCAGLSCLSLSACTSPDLSGMRPEIATPLSQAESLWRHGQKADAMDSIKVAEAVPDQTAGEKQRVAEVVAYIHRSFSGSDNIPFQPQFRNNQPSIGVDSYLPPGDVGQNDPNR